MNTLLEKEIIRIQESLDLCGVAETLSDEATKRFEGLYEITYIPLTEHKSGRARPIFKRKYTIYIKNW